MKPTPSILDDAQLVCYTPIDRRHKFTGKTRQIVRGKWQGAMAGLAICRHSDAAFYLFGCNAEWQVVTDTFHPSLEEAKDQAEFEYEGSRKTWITVNEQPAPQT
jgi:hypothetical protein